MDWIKQYVMPKSVTWWPGFIMLMSGIVMASAKGFPNLQPWADILHAIWGMDSAPLVAFGMAVIGGRKKLEDMGK